MILISTSCLKGTGNRFEKSLARVLSAYSKLGIKNIELGSALRPPVSLAQVLKYKKQHSSNFTIHSVFPPDNEDLMINFASQTGIRQISIAKAKEAVEFARRIDALIYSFHPGFLSDVNIKDQPITKLIDKELAFKTAVQSISEVVDYTNQYGIKVAAENVYPGENKDEGPYNLFNQPEEFLNLFKEIDNKNFGMLLDIGHMIITCDMQKLSINDFVSKIEHKIFELHLHEVVNGIDHQKLTSSKILRYFQKQTLKKAALVLEPTNLTAEEIVECKKIVESAIP